MHASLIKTANPEPYALTQSLQNPLIKESTLNCNRIPNMIYKVYSLIKGFWSLHGPKTIQSMDFGT